MKALVLEEFGGPLRLKELPPPEPGPGEVLVRVRACAVDQFDLTIRAGKLAHARVPLILGHEIAGEVVGLGPGVTRWQPGQRVTSTLYLTCGRCRHCQTGRETICENFIGYVGIQTPGGYAEYTTVPEANLVELPESIPFAEGAILANAIGTPFHAFTKRMRLYPGEQIVITGAGGGVGLHAIQLARMMGARVLAVDIGPAKLEAANANGAEITIDPTTHDFAQAARDWTHGRGVDAILELTGAATLPTSLRALGKGGRLVIVGFHTGSKFAVEASQMVANEWEILGSRNVTKRELAEVTALVQAGQVRPVVSGVYPLAEAESLHTRLRQQQILGRVVLEI
ncbi:MAG: alcohol dehydrogenase [Anaerolineae bacterium]|nr:alcohol dehydrogenase [Anaerolineae bacterium]